MWYVNINKNVIASNAKHGTDEPPVRFQKGKYGKATYAHEIELLGPSRVVYTPHDKLLPCGARLVIVSDAQPVVIR